MIRSLAILLFSSCDVTVRSHLIVMMSVMVGYRTTKSVIIADSVDGFVAWFISRFQSQ